MATKSLNKQEQQSKFRLKQGLIDPKGSKRMLFIVYKMVKEVSGNTVVLIWHECGDCYAILCNYILVVTLYNIVTVLLA